MSRTLSKEIHAANRLEKRTDDILHRLDVRLSGDVTKLKTEGHSPEAATRIIERFLLLFIDKNLKSNL